MFTFGIKITGWTGGPETNFPFLFSEAVSSIPAAFWSSIVDTIDGLDIRFFDTDGVTELKREIDSVNVFAHSIESWVQIPSIAVNKIIYCKCGGATKVNDTGLWDDIGLQGVWHCKNLAMLDSTANHNDCTIAGTPSIVPGKIGNAFFTNAQIDHFDAGNSASLQLGPSAGCLSCWFYASGSYYIYDTLICKMHQSVVGGYLLGASGGDPYFDLGARAGLLAPNHPYSLAAWHHLYATWDGSSQYLYLDGVPNGVQAIAANMASVYNLWLGAGIGYSGFKWNGKIDEVRVGNACFGANWIANEFASQNDPGTFAECISASASPSGFFPFFI
jgi:hypothetical protein